MSLTDTLSPEHYEEIVHDSCVDPGVALARGYRTLLGHQDERQELEDIGFKPYTWNRDDAYPGLLIPMHGADGSVRGHQFKPAVPRVRMKSDGTPAPIKYETPPGAPNVLDVPEFTRQRLADTSAETPSLWITEGMKKVDALVSQGMAAVGLTGVFNWKSRHGTLGDWEDIPLKGRPVVVCFDSDAAGNRHVQLAMSRLGAWLHSRGASAVHYLVVPAEVDGMPVKGVDDFFAAGGTLETLKEAATQKPPGVAEKDASFTDAFLVEELAEALEGRFCWASGLGWLRWNGRLWKEVSDVEPLEAVRVWASEQYDKVLAEQGRDKTANLTPKIAGWRAVLGKSRLTALRDLARGLIQRDAAEFDGDPDLLTVLNGTLHLPTGRLLPFDPAHHITKSADAEYHRDATHPLWNKALQAIPEDLHSWYQDRLGQAMTGHPVPDHTLVIAHGTGSNGKSVIVSTIRRTMGDYGVTISDRVLMASPDAHPTELMDLRGARYAVMEETPEARHLNVQRLKTVLGTESIKARRIRQDPVEFLASHSLFINTNYRPVVTETDWGTWRRLSLMPYPYTFHKPGAPLESPWDRAGDPKLAYSQNDPQVRTAALAWMAAGAREWYARGRMMLAAPERVERVTRAWRAETDLILGFSDERLRFDPEAFTQTRDMLTAFNEWAGERGHRPWNDRTFATRFGDHDTVRGARVKQGRFTVGGKQQRGWGGVEVRKGSDPWGGDWQDAPPNDPHVGPEEFPERECFNCDVIGCMGCPARDPRNPFDYSDAPVTPHPEDEWEITADSDLTGVPDPGEWTEVREGGEVIGYSQPVALPHPEDADQGRPEPERETDATYCGHRACNPHECFEPGGQDAYGSVQNLPETSTPQVRTPVTLGFDLETADADQLFIGGHEGPFVRLGGIVDRHSADLSTDADAIVRDLVTQADTIYGHNILGFDLLALAHHHGADYDALAAKAVDTQALEYLVDPPLSKGMPSGYYKLNTLAERYGVPGKTDDIKALARKHGGFDKIPLNDAEYQDYLRGDLTATKAVYERQQARIKELGLESYADREMRVVALQNRMTLNGWAVDTRLLAERVAQEDAKREAAIVTLGAEFGVPLNEPDKYKLKSKGDWPEEYRSIAITDARVMLRDRPQECVSIGIATVTPGGPQKSPWATKEGRPAIERALHEAGAKYLPRTKDGHVALSKEALGDAYWYDKNQKKSVPGLQVVYGDKPGVVRIAETLLLATGARKKYAEVEKYVASTGRVHGPIGSSQGSGRWSMSPFTTMGKRTKAAARERDVMVADEGHMLLTCDLSQCDVRTMAALSQDPELIARLQPGMDFHEEMAEMYCGDRSQRNGYKPVSHGTNYGMQARAIAEQYRLPLGMVQAALDARSDTFHVLDAYTNTIRAQAEAGILLDNGFGRPMRPDPLRAFTQAPALMGQGATRDVMCESLLRLVDARPDVRPFLRAVVHDELVLSVPADTVEEWAGELREAMTWEWRGVPILCEVSKPALRWSECK